MDWSGTPHYHFRNLVTADQSRGLGMTEYFVVALSGPTTVRVEELHQCGEFGVDL
jgi:hypothetical protein